MPKITSETFSQKPDAHRNARRVAAWAGLAAIALPSFTACAISREVTRHYGQGGQTSLSSAAHNPCTQEPYICPVKPATTDHNKTVFSFSPAKGPGDITLFTDATLQDAAGFLLATNTFTVDCIRGDAEEFTIVSDAGDVNHLNKNFVPDAITGYGMDWVFDKQFTAQSNVAAVQQTYHIPNC